jgi:rubrerythrin
MPESKTDREIIELLAYHEEALSYMYESFYKKFGRGVWEGLCREERKHTEWVRSVLDNVTDGSVFFEKRNFTIESVSVSIDNVVDEKIACEEGRRTLTEAFEFAIKIENDMVEKHFLDSFWSENESIQIVLGDLRSDTILHKELLVKDFEKYKEEKRDEDDTSSMIYTKSAILGFHSEYERNLARLYSVYAEKFPDVELWRFLVEEERKHESWIKQIIIKVSEGVIDFELKEYTAEKVKNCIINLKDKVIETVGLDIDLKTALLNALEVEDSMLEKDFFDKFTSDAPAVQSVLSKLVSDTINHRYAIEEAINALDPDK